MVPITIRDLEIGTGMPKVCLPIVGHTQYEIVSQTMTIASLKPDIVEWRADFLSADEILEMAPKFFEKFKESKILFTLRTVREGGNIQVSEKKYLQILKIGV